MERASAEISLRKRLALLIYLAVTRRAHTRDALATLFWPEGDQRSARANLRRLLHDRTNPALEFLVPAVRDEDNLDALIQVARLELARPLDALLLLESPTSRIPAQVEPVPSSPAMLAQASQPSVANALIEPLTSRESEILQLIADGLTNKEIAARLYLSTGTVKWYTSQIFSKLGARNRTQAVTQAKALHLLA